MTTTDPRALLAEMQARAEDARRWWTAEEDIDRDDLEAILSEAPKAYAALTAVLDAERNPAADAGQVGDQFDRGYNSGYANAYSEMRTAITDALGGDRG